MQLKWSHAVIYVKDLPGMLEFYTEVLGFAVTDRGKIGGKGPELVFMSQVPTDHHQIAMVQVPETSEQKSVNHFAFRVDRLDDVREMVARLGDTQFNPVTHGNTWSIYFNDPEGNGIEVFCDTPFHVQQPQGDSWDVSQSDETLLQATRQRFENEPGFTSAETFYETLQARFPAAP